jgi:hypothetical protein
VAVGGFGEWILGPSGGNSGVWINNMVLYTSYGGMGCGGCMSVCTKESVGRWIGELERKGGGEKE